ncbi:unnamed protein product, partial [Rotaria sp. Silwood1]
SYFKIEYSIGKISTQINRSNESNCDKIDEETQQQREKITFSLIYCFRLSTKEDNAQRNDHYTSSRENLGEFLSENIPDFVKIIQNELE